MALPSWIGDQYHRIAAIKQAKAAPINLGAVPDSPWTAPGWKEINIEWTCIPDAVYPWRADILKKIHEFDPSAAPLWMRWTFLSPDNKELVTFGRHAIGRYKPVLTEDVPTIKVKGAPAGMQAPNIVELIWMDDNEESDLPGKYRPFDGTLLNHLRKRYNTKSVAALKQERRELVAAILARLHKMAEERDYMNRDLDRYVDKKLAQMSDVELKETFANLQFREKSRRPFVNVGLPR